MKKVIIIGGGPAGMMAAIQSASCGCNVTIVEKNEKLGKKLFITGKGRCNLTNACDISDLFSNVISNPKFLYSAFYSFTNEQVVVFLISMVCLQKWSVESAFFRHRINLLMSSEHWRRSVKDLV